MTFTVYHHEQQEQQNKYKQKLRDVERNEIEYLTASPL